VLCAAARLCRTPNGMKHCASPGQVGPTGRQGMQLQALHVMRAAQRSAAQRHTLVSVPRRMGLNCDAHRRVTPTRSTAVRIVGEDVSDQQSAHMNCAAVV
jgi:hypothetical protein